MGEQAGPDFFVSYASEDESWAKWIATELEKAGRTTVSQVQDFRPGHDFVHEIHRAVGSADRTIAVLSPDYLDSEFGEAEWRVAFASDPSGQLGKLVPVKVRACRPPGLLRARVYIDLVDVDEDTARRRLLDGVGPTDRRRVRTTYPGPMAFPGTSAPRATTPGRAKPRVLAAGIAVLVAVTTSTAWALSTAAPLPGRPSAASGVSPASDPTEAVVANTEPPDPSGSLADASGAARAAVAPPGVRQPADGPPPARDNPQPPQVPPLEITTDGLPSITVGESLSVTLEAKGGVAPYEWSIVGAPDGLVLQPPGRITGTATTPGRTSFKVRVVDKQGKRATRTFELSVEPEPLRGDINGDRAVDCADMDIPRSDWGATGSGLRSDLDGDESVGTPDMSVVLSNWTGDPDSDC